MRKEGRSAVFLLILFTLTGLTAASAFEGILPRNANPDEKPDSPASPVSCDAGFAGLIDYYSQAVTGGLIPEHEVLVPAEADGGAAVCLRSAGEREYLVLEWPGRYELFSLDGGEPRQRAAITRSVTGYYRSASATGLDDLALEALLEEQALARGMADQAWSCEWEGLVLDVSMTAGERGDYILTARHPENSRTVTRLVFSPEYQAVVKYSP